MLVGTVVLVGALTYVPALALGPVVEHLQLYRFISVTQFSRVKLVRKSLTLFDSALMGPAVADSFRKLSPRVQIRNPVMFVVFIGSILTSILFVQALRGQGEARRLHFCG